MYTLTSGVLTYGASSDEPMALLIPTVFIVAIYIMVEGLEKDICKIATYINIFFEENEQYHLMWEKRVQEYDEVNQKGKNFFEKGLMMYLSSLWICAVFSLYRVCSMYCEYSCLGWICRINFIFLWTGLCTCLCITNQVNFYELRESEKEKWQKVIKKEAEKGI